MRYDKELVKKDGRHLIRGGPRDMQRRQQMDSMVGDSAVVEVLRQEMADLKHELSNRHTSRGTAEFTAEQVDEEINKAVSHTIAELKLTFEEERKELKANAYRLKLELDNLKQKLTLIDKEREIDLKELRSKIATQQEQLDSKEIIVRDLKDALAAGGMRTTAPIEPELDRPKMETVFIDPLEEGAGNALVSHITVEDVSIDEKEKMEDKVNKLRNILGKLPTKRMPRMDDDETED